MPVGSIKTVIEFLKNRRCTVAKNIKSTIYQKDNNMGKMSWHKLSLIREK